MYQVGSIPQELQNLHDAYCINFTKVIISVVFRVTSNPIFIREYERAWKIFNHTHNSLGNNLSYDKIDDIEILYGNAQVRRKKPTNTRNLSIGMAWSRILHRNM